MADQRRAVLAVGVVFPILATAAVMLRCYARRLKRVSLGPDDWLMVSALVMSLGLTADYFVAYASANLGGHSLDNAPPPLVFSPPNKTFWQTVWVFQLLALPSLGLTKASTLFLYARIFPSRGFQLWTRIWLGVVIAWTVAFFVASVVECVPVAAIWGDATHATCADIEALFGANYSTSSILTIIIVTLPIYKVWNLQLSLARKMGVSALFILGSGTVAAGLVRTVALIRVTPIVQNGDLSYIFAPIFIWSLIQVDLGIVSASLPCLPPVFQAFLQWQRGHSLHTGAQQEYPSIQKGDVPLVERAAFGIPDRRSNSGYHGTAPGNIGDSDHGSWSERQSDANLRW